MRSPWRAIAENLSERTRRWARKRHGPDPPQVTLASRRIYILPTASGLLYAVMIATMLAGAMNYNNNLGFAFTFLLAGVGIVTIYHTHRTLVNLRVHYLGAERVFAGDSLDVRFSLINDSAQPREEIYLDWNSCAAVAGGVQPKDARIVRLPLKTTRRGWLQLPGLRLSTRSPLGVFQAWTWVHMDPRPVVYPRPADRAEPARRPDHSAVVDNAQQHGDDDFAGLRDYRAGDSPRRIAWKSFARTGAMLVREYRGGSDEEPIWIDWEAIPECDVESRVARLTRLVLVAFEEDRSWGLRVPGTRIDPGRGPDQLHRCLSCLATVALPVTEQP